MIIGIIVWLCIGAFVGWIASLVTKSDGEMGAGLNILCGIIGAALGGFIMRLLGASGANINEVISPYSVLVSIGGAILLIVIVKALRGVGRGGRHAH